MRDGNVRRLRTSRLAAVVLIALVASCAPMGRNDALPGAATVSRVEDGDTVVLEDGTTVRLLGINAPERDQPFFAEAKRLAEELLLGKRVRLEYDVERWDKMQRSRLLAYVFVGDLLVNEEVVRRGMASRA